MKGPPMKNKLVEVITSDEEAIRLRIFEGSLPLEEAKEELYKTKISKLEKELKIMSSKLILPKTIEAKEEDSNVMPFLSTVPGGKDPTYNWLKNDIIEGQTFVSRRRTSTQMDQYGKLVKGYPQLILDEWTLVNNRNKTFLLLTNLNQEAYVRVISEEFSRDMECVEVLE